MVEVCTDYISATVGQEKESEILITEKRKQRQRSIQVR
jgi:hypothetical protein